MATLTINITKSCNLKCEFCINDYKMKDDTRMVKDLPELLEDHLIQYGDDYDTFAISGGEPFIDESKMEKVLSVLLTHSLEKKIIINANGCYLTPNIVNVINQYSNIVLFISVDGVQYRERGLFKLLNEDYKQGYLTLQSIRNVRNKAINIVVNKEMIFDDNLAGEIALMSSFFNSTISIILDSREEQLNSLDLDDAYKLGRLIYNLNLLGVYDSINFKYFFNQPCYASKNKIFSWDGTVQPYCLYDSHSGCGRFRNLMKPGLYDVIYKLINFRENNDTDIDTTPAFDNTGYVGVRENDITPIRKNWKNSIDIIPIKEVY